MRFIHRRSYSPRGFTLIETLIAMIICFLAILATLSVVPFGFSNVQTNSVHAQAVAVAQRYLDDERNALLQLASAMPTATTVPIDPGQSFTNAGVSNSGYGNFTITPDGCVTKQFTGASGANVYLCTVTVSWTESGALRSVTEQTYVTK